MTTQVPRAFNFGLAHRVLSWLERALETPNQRRLRQRVARIESLRALSDAELHALGLTRETIAASVFAGQI